MELKDRARIAVKRYLELTGRHVIYVDFLDRFIVAEDDNGLAFIDVFYTTDDMSTHIPIAKRDVFEDAIYKFFYQEHDPIDVPVRYDTVELFICGDNRAIVRHNVNVELEG
jgi:hypothetical protein